MSAVEHNTDHVGEALDRLLEQFRGKERLEALVRSIVAGTQDIEDALWEMHTTGFDLDTATGEQLDVIGRILDAKREESEEPEALLITLGDELITTLSGVALAVQGTTFGEDDDTYRLVLKAWLRSIRSQGRASDLYRIMRLLVGSGVDLDLDDQPPAQVWCQIRDDVGDGVPRVIGELLGIAAAAAVRAQLTHPPSGASSGLRLADVNGGTTSGDATLGDVNGGHTGGLFADVIEGARG